MKLNRHVIIGAWIGALAIAGIGAVAFKGAENETPFGASIKQTDRRVWVVDENTAWWPGENGEAGFFLRASGTGLSKTDYSFTKVVEIASGKSLYYCDVPVAVTGFKLHKLNASLGNTNQSPAIEIYPFGGPDTYYLSANHEEWNPSTSLNDRSLEGHRYAGFNGTVIQHVLGHYDTCSSSFASGYKAYPQLYTNFILPIENQLDLSLPIIAGPKDNGYSGILPTIGQKMDAIEAKHFATL